MVMTSLILEYEQPKTKGGCNERDMNCVMCFGYAHEIVDLHCGPQQYVLDLHFDI